MIGRVPFEQIEAVEWGGDEYYSFPHIYCYFDAKNKQPYEELVLCAENKHDDQPPWYSEVAKYEDALKRSRKLGIDHFG